MLVIFFAKLDDVISKQYQKIFEVSCHNQNLTDNQSTVIYYNALVAYQWHECVGHWFSLPLYVYTLWADVDTVILHLSCIGIYIYPSHIMIMSSI